MILRKHFWAVMLIYLRDAVAIIWGVALSHYLCNRVLSAYDWWSASTGKLICYGIWILFAVYAIAIIINAFRFLNTGDILHIWFGLEGLMLILSPVAAVFAKEDLIIIFPFLKNVIPESMFNFDSFTLLFITFGIMISTFYAIENIEIDPDV